MQPWRYDRHGLYKAISQSVSHVNLINGSEVQTPNQCKDIIQLSVIMAICNMVLDDACPARILDNDD